MGLVEGEQVGGQREEELRANHPVAGAHHGYQADVRVFDLGSGFCLEVSLVATLQDPPDGGATVAGPRRIASLGNEVMLEGMGELLAIGSGGHPGDTHRDIVE